MYIVKYGKRVLVLLFLIILNYINIFATETIIVNNNINIDEFEEEFYALDFFNEETTSKYKNLKIDLSQLINNIQSNFKDFIEEYSQIVQLELDEITNDYIIKNENLFKKNINQFYLENKDNKDLIDNYFNFKNGILFARFVKKYKTSENFIKKSVFNKEFCNLYLKDNKNSNCKINLIEKSYIKNLFDNDNYKIKTDDIFSYEILKVEIHKLYRIYKNQYLKDLINFNEFNEKCYIRIKELIDLFRDYKYYYFNKQIQFLVEIEKTVKNIKENIDQFSENDIIDKHLEFKKKITKNNLNYYNNYSYILEREFNEVLNIKIKTYLKK